MTSLYPNAVTGGAMSMKDLEARLQNEAQNTDENDPKEDTVDSQENSVTHEEPTDHQKKKETDWEKRYRDLQSYHAKQLKEKESKIKELEAATAKPLLSEDELRLLETVKSDHADTYTMVKAIAMKEVHEELQKYKEALSEVQAKLAETEKEKGLEQSLRIIEKVHPDVRKIKDSPEFIAWLNEQSQGVKELAMRGSTDDAIVVLNLFKSTNPQKDTKSKSKALTSVPSSRPTSPEPSLQGKIWAASEIKALSRNLNEYMKFKDEIDQAHREGRINPNA